MSALLSHQTAVNKHCFDLFVTRRCVRGRKSGSCLMKLIQASPLSFKGPRRKKKEKLQSWLENVWGKKKKNAIRNSRFKSKINKENITGILTFQNITRHLHQRERQGVKVNIHAAEPHLAHVKEFVVWREKSYL